MTEVTVYDVVEEARPLIANPDTWTARVLATDHEHGRSSQFEGLSLVRSWGVLKDRRQSREVQAIRLNSHTHTGSRDISGAVFLWL